MTYAAKINGAWTEKTPRQFRDERNASIPAANLEAEGLLKVVEDPKPETPGKIAEPGPIVEREGKPYRTWTERDPTPEEIERTRETLHRQKDRAYSAAMHPISKAYPAEEREGWSEQIDAAKEVLAGGQSDLIDALRALTGETATEMAQAIVNKRSQYLGVYGRATARRRELETQIRAATTLSDLAAIDVNAGW